MDWILHRRDDDILQTTHASHELTSDHFTIVSDLLPKQPPASLVQDIKQCLNPSMTFTAAQLDSILRSLLDKHAFITSCKTDEKKVPLGTTLSGMHFEL